jgi:hypothetical protein
MKMLLSIILNDKDVDRINKIYGVCSTVQILIDTDRMESAKEMSGRLEDSVRIKPFLGGEINGR